MLDLILVLVAADVVLVAVVVLVVTGLADDDHDHHLFFVDETTNMFQTTLFISLTKFSRNFWIELKQNSLFGFIRYSDKIKSNLIRID